MSALGRVEAQGVPAGTYKQSGVKNSRERPVHVDGLTIQQQPAFLGPCDDFDFRPPQPSFVSGLHDQA